MKRFFKYIRRMNNFRLINIYFKIYYLLKIVRKHRYGDSELKSKYNKKNKHTHTKKNQYISLNEVFN